jgi:hypothetical protein
MLQNLVLESESDRLIQSTSQTNVRRVMNRLKAVAPSPMLP